MIIDCFYSGKAIQCFHLSWIWLRGNLLWFVEFIFVFCQRVICLLFNAQVWIWYMTENVFYSFRPSFLSRWHFLSVGDWGYFTAYRNASSGNWISYDSTHTITFDNWGTDQPSYSYSENCLTYFLLLHLQWINSPCSDRLRMVCEIDRVYKADF